MEYDGWSRREALDEVRRLGFGEYACTTANDYIKQYVLTYQPRQRRSSHDSAAVVRATIP
jgi:hypothetical protein